MCQSEQGRRAGAGELTFGAASIARHIAAALAEEGSRSLMLSGSLAQPCSLARLAVPALLERFRLLLPDLEKTSGTDPLAGLFQVRHAASHAGERSVYRKSDLTAFARNDQISATYRTATRGPTRLPRRPQARHTL